MIVSCPKLQFYRCATRLCQWVWCDREITREYDIRISNEERGLSTSHWWKSRTQQFYLKKITIWATRKATQPVSNFAQQLLPARNNMQQGVDAACNIQPCWEFWATMLTQSQIHVGVKVTLSCHWLFFKVFAAAVFFISSCIALSGSSMA